uniref:Uncharacterized protein n=1 Tax=viral metagenome TaxID=1070528 RepID=A0A6C0JZN5_9ZZZZ
MFAALDAIKNTLFSFNPISSRVAHPINAITSFVGNNGDNDSNTEPMIDQVEPITKEIEHVYVFDKRPYTVNNLVSGEPEDFHYLHGENLTQSYEFCLNKSSSLVVHICMVAMDFQCNYSGEHLPFLRFLMEYGSSTIDFPKCTIMCNMGDDNDAEYKMDEMDNYFHNECKKRVLDFFVVEGQMSKTGDFGERLNNSYRGYKEMGEGELVAVFDITDFLNIPLRTSRNPGWMILDDFENPVLPFIPLLHNIENVSQSAQAPTASIISPKVLQFFRENEYMKQIRDPLNNLVETPKSMYLYDTVYSRFMMNAEKSEWLEPRSFHPIYGNFYYLKSLNNLSANENPQVIESYRKCAVFLKNYADFLENNDTSSVDLNGEHIEYSETKEGDKSEEKEEAVGGSTNSDISVSTDDLDLDVDDLELSEDSDDDEYLQNYTGEYDKTEIRNNLPFISLIMFSEKGEHIYCVKTESIFTEI